MAENPTHEIIIQWCKEAQKEIGNRYPRSNIVFSVDQATDSHTTVTAYIHDGDTIKVLWIEHFRTSPEPKILNHNPNPNAEETDYKILE